MSKKSEDFLRVKMENYLNHTGETLSELEVMVVKDMWEKGYQYPYISVDAVKAFWAERGIFDDRSCNLH